jgi:hypothetical protein
MCSSMALPATEQEHMSRRTTAGATFLPESIARCEGVTEIVMNKVPIIVMIYSLSEAESIAVSPEFDSC